MRDPEAAKAVGFTVHAGINNCVYGDSCQGQRDEVSNLTRAMTNDLFHVDFHSVTANTKTFEAFVQEVRVRALVLSLSPIQRLAACLQPHLLPAPSRGAEAGERQPGHLCADSTPPMDRQASPLIGRSMASVLLCVEHSNRLNSVSGSGANQV
jgi:hypothetical protein